jgi:predicted Ser/Thr protein kinase/WD40 repeat protein
MQPGTKLGPYEILAPLGAGGMGEVYRARDTRLGRDVALKVLPADFTSDSSRRQRFEQEARAVAALNHPNIVAIYDVGDNYFVSELVEGETLRAAKLSLRKLLDIAVQIAGGLAAAHAAGIVHRDLKPDNILLTRDGRVKILDFGLAKIRAAQAAAAEGTQTLTVRTDPGVVMGTVGYMSPEQVRGLEVDHRSDIFSFGVILHEMLSGKRAFQGETSMDTMQAILRQDPPDLPDTVPAALGQIVAHCLEKEPSDRFQSARDLGFALSQSTTFSGPAPKLAPRRNLRWPLIAAAAAIAAALAAHQWWRTPSPPSWRGVVLGGPEAALMPRPSPDGHLVAFIDRAEQIGVMKPESGNWTHVTHAIDKGWLSGLSWSPDGARIYYDRWTDLPRGIYAVPVLGGPEQLILENAAVPEALPDGTLLVMRYNQDRQPQLFRFWPETRRLQAFPISLYSYATSPIRVFPDGRTAIVAGAFMGAGSDRRQHVWLLDLDSGKVRRFLSPSEDDSTINNCAVSRDGKSVWFSRIIGNAMLISTASREGHILMPSVLTLTNAVYSMDIGSDGSLYVDQIDRPGALLRFRPNGGTGENIAAITDNEVVGSANSVAESFAILPDGRAAITLGSNGRKQLMIVELGKDPLPLINTAEETSTPAVAVGSDRIAFLIGSQAKTTIAIADSSNGAIIIRIPFDKGAIHSLAASADGNTLYASAQGEIWSIAASGGEPKKLRSGDLVTADPAGKYLLVEVVESPMMRLFRVPLDGSPEQEIHLTGGIRPAGVLGPNAIGRDGRIVTPVGSATWYWPLGILDPLSGQFAHIPVDRILDYHVAGWTPDGKVMALGLDLRGKMWKFTPDAH